MFKFSGSLLTGSSIISKSEDLLESYEILNNFIRDIPNLFVIYNVQYLIQKCDFYIHRREKRKDFEHPKSIYYRLPR